MIDNLYEKQNKLECWCRACCKRETGYPHLFRMVVCPTCGNKRCPKAANHVLECSGSNDPDQLAMTEYKEARLIEAIETISQATEVDAKEIIYLLTGFCWDGEEGYRMEKLLSRRVK